MRGRLHCFPADDGSHNWSVPASERAALTSAGVNVNTTRRHHVSLKAGKGEKRKHLWPSDVSCKQTDQAVMHCRKKKKRQGRKKPTSRCGVGLVTAAQSNRRCAGGVAFFSGQEREESFKEEEVGGGRQGLFLSSDHRPCPLSPSQPSHLPPRPPPGGDVNCP